MKKLLLLFSFTFFSVTIFAQDSKAYLGVSAGVAVPGGISMEGVETGIDLGFIHFGYRFNENWGATLNLNSSGHLLEDISDASIGIAYWGIGPMYCLLINDNMIYELKPQLALNLTGLYIDEPNYSGLDGFEVKGNGFILANSFVIGSSKGFKLSINADYVFGNWTEGKLGGQTMPVVDNSEFSKLSIGAGVRYNF